MKFHVSVTSSPQQQQPDEEAADLGRRLQAAHQPVCAGCHGHGVTPQVPGKRLGRRGGRTDSQASALSPHFLLFCCPRASGIPEVRVLGATALPDVASPPQAENIMFLELDVSPPAVFEMEFSHDQDQDPRALHMERLMRLDSFLERPSTSKVRKSRSWSVPQGRGKGVV